MQQLTAIIVAVAAMIAVHLLLRATKLGLAMWATAAGVSLTEMQASQAVVDAYLGGGNA